MLNSLNSWRLPKKIFISFAIIAEILATVPGSSIYAIRTMSEIAHAHVNRGFAGTEALGHLVSALREDRIIIWSRMNSTSLHRTGSTIPVSRRMKPPLTADIHAELPPAYVELRTYFNEGLASLRDLSVR